MPPRALCALTALGMALSACTTTGSAEPTGAPSVSARRTPATPADARPGPEGSPSPSATGSERPKATPSGRPPRAVRPEARPRTRVTIVGDIMLGRGVGEAGEPGAPLRPLRRRLAAADITVGNLESTLSRAGAPRQGDDSFAASPRVVPALAGAGFDVLSLANNHTGDFGPTALLRTLRRLDRSPVEALGAGRDRARAWRPVVVTRHGVRFGFVAFNAIGETPRATAEAPGAASVRMQPRTGPLSAADLRRAVRAIRTADADVVVALPHWGAQYTHVPVPAQRRVGRALLDAGADIVVGGHPHWVQRVQRHRDGLVLHSLGNFVFDMDFMRQTQEGVLADLVFAGERLRAVRFTPYVIGPDFAPRVVGGARARAVLRPLGVPRVVRLP